MARYVRVAAISIHPRSVLDKPADQNVFDYVIGWLKEEIALVLPEKPDLIVIPECCDRPRDLSAEEVQAYYASRNGEIENYLCSVARDNHCYVAYGYVREAEDGYRRNSCIMIDREGKIMGAYDKNFPTIGEKPHYNILPGEEEHIFECDFGRVGAIICFDLNFEEIRAKYKKAKPDIMVFPSNFGGGMMRNFFAYDTQSHFVAACGWLCPAEVINPLGETLTVTGLNSYYNYVIQDINLDCAVVHLDFNKAKIRAAQDKYGKKLTMRVGGFLGVVMLSCEAEDMTVHDIIKEFDIEYIDDYFARSKTAIEENLRMMKQ